MPIRYPGAIHHLIDSHCKSIEMDISARVEIKVSKEVSNSRHFLYFVVGDVIVLDIEIPVDKWQECQVMGIGVVGQGKNFDSRDSYAVYQELMAFINNRYGRNH